MTSKITLTLCEVEDTEDGVVRLDASDMHTLGVSQNDVISATGNRKVYLIVKSSLIGDHNQRLAGVSPQTANNLGYTSGQKINLVSERVHIPFAERVTLKTPDYLDQIHAISRKNQIGIFWNNRVLNDGDEISIPTLSEYSLKVKVSTIQPEGPAKITSSTEFSVGTNIVDNSILKIGGLREDYKICKSLSEKLLKQNTSISAHSVLLSGISGCGKSQLIKRLAQEMKVEFQTLDAYQLVDDYIAQGSIDLSGYLHDIAKKGKSILMIDHLEALSLKDEQSSVISTASRFVVAQLCSLLDDASSQPNVLVFGITSKDLEDRFYNNQRFGVHLRIDPPNRWGRYEILYIATEEMLLNEDVDLSLIAELSTGMTAKNLNDLVRCAALSSKEKKIKQNDFISAFRSIIPSAKEDVQCDIPSTLWNEVAGLDDIKQLLCETISWSLLEDKKFSESGIRPPKSILLSGGEGTGKTSLVRALAGFMPMHFIEVNCPVLITKRKDIGQKYLKDCFNLARRKAPCLIFFDDIDVFFESISEHDEDIHYHNSIISQLLVELDALSNMKGVIVIAATNRPDRLSKDMLKPDRFDFALTLPMPNLSARKKILQIHARKLPLSAEIDFDQLALSINGMSSAEIANLCNRVGLMAIRNSMNKSSGMPVVTPDLFAQALRGRKS